jgi:glycerophosphoryl diester phosphodiesterase
LNQGPKRSKDAWPRAIAAGGWEKSFVRIGHGGASGHAPANTLRSLELALEMGVDVVEFDVQPCRDGLVLTHDATLVGPDGRSRLVAECTLADLRRGDGYKAGLPVLYEALDLLKDRTLLNLDIKAAGCEDAVIDALRDKGMLQQTLISSLVPDSLRRIRALEPAALTGYSYPEDRRGVSQKGYLKPVVDLAVVAMRRALPYRLPGMMARAAANAVMLNYRIVSPAAVRAVHALGGKVFVWTIDDLPLMQRVRTMGVNGITSNYPDRLMSLS